jgi:hypothetical protein
MSHKRPCTALTSSGRPCRAWAVGGSDPPRCAAHGGVKARANPASSVQTAPPPEEPPILPQEAERSRFYARDPEAVSIEQTIAGLVDKLARLDDIIASYQEARSEPGEADPYLVRLFSLYTQASSRLARLLEARQAMRGEIDDEITRAIAQALGEVGPKLGVDLGPPRPRT